MRSKDRESRHVVTQAEFLARREAVERTMVVRERERHDRRGMITQVAVLEDGMRVEQFVTDETNTSQIGNLYLVLCRTFCHPWKLRSSISEQAATACSTLAK